MDIIEIVSILITSGAGYFFGWFFSRKKQNIDNIDAAIGTWQKVVDSLEGRCEKLTNNNNILSDENDTLKKEKRNLTERITELEDKIDKMYKEIKELSDLKMKIKTLEELIAEKNKRITELELKLKKTQI